MTTIQIRVKTLDSNTFEIKVGEAASIPALKQQVFLESGVEAERQRLIFQGKVLKDDKDVKFYSIKDGMTIHMVERLPNTERLGGNDDAPQRDDPTSRLFQPGPTSFQISETPEGFVVGARIDIDDDRMPFPPMGALLSSMFGMIRRSQAQPSDTPESSSSRPSSASSTPFRVVESSLTSLPPGSPAISFARFSNIMPSPPGDNQHSSLSSSSRTNNNNERPRPHGPSSFARRRRVLNSNSGRAEGSRDATSRTDRDSVNASTDRLRQSIRNVAAQLDSFLSEDQLSSSASNTFESQHGASDELSTMGFLGESLLAIGTEVRELLPVLERMGFVMQNQFLQLQVGNSDRTERIDSVLRRLYEPCGTLADGLSAMSELSRTLSENLRRIQYYRNAADRAAARRRASRPHSSQTSAIGSAASSANDSNDDDLQSSIFNIMRQLIGGPLSMNRPRSSRSSPAPAESQQTREAESSPSRTLPTSTPTSAGSAETPRPEAGRGRKRSRSSTETQQEHSNTARPSKRASSSNSKKKQ